jgi:hypothetical protein
LVCEIAGLATRAGWIMNVGIFWTTLISAVFMLFALVAVIIAVGEGEE